MGRRQDSGTGKKTLNFFCTFGPIDVCERIWRTENSSYLRALSERIGIKPKEATRALERAVSDFGLEKSFPKAVEGIKEHYGFELSAGLVRSITLRHAQAIRKDREQREPVRTLPAKGKAVIIAQGDGSLVCIVENNGKADRRKKRKLSWREARLCLAQGQGEVGIQYEGTFDGVERTGQLWQHAAKAAGWGLESYIHALGDGANWVAGQALEKFSPQVRFTVDLYHVCDYLSAAARSCCSKQKPRRWVRTQKKRLLRGDLTRVLSTLEEYLEAPEVKDEEAPVRAAHRYLSNRKEHLDYPTALDKELPVGSGMIESAHKSVIQQRLKGPGMAWKLDNAESMLQARCLRASGAWNQYWVALAA